MLLQGFSSLLHVGFEAAATAYGRASVELLAAQITELKAGDALAPVTVLVPSNYAAVSTRRALAARPGGIAAVDFLTVHRLAERLGGPKLAADGRRPISAPVLAEAVRAVLGDEPGIFEPVAGHPATELALVTATRELGGVTEEALDAVSRCSRRAEDVVRIARRVRTDLALGWHDQHDLVLAAMEAVAGGAWVDPLVVHLLQDLSPAGAALLVAVSQRQTVKVNVGITGAADADRAVLDAHAHAGVTVDPGAIEPRRAQKVVTVSDPDEEVRATVRCITQWMRDGVRLGRTAVLYATSDPYARLLHEQLDAAGVPHNGAPVRDIGELLLGRTLRALLSLPERNFRRTDVLAVLAGAPMAGLPSRRWEEIARKAGVVQGADWRTRLAGFADEQRERAGRLDPNEDQWRIDKLERDASRAEELAAFVAELRADLVAPDGGWAELAQWARSLVSTYLGDDRHRARWPEEEQEAADRVDAALERLGNLDAVGGPSPTLDIFRRTLDSELDVSLRRVGRFGDGVLVGHVSMAVGLDLDRVVVLGLAEGAFPARRLEDSLLPDDERRSADGELKLRTDRVHDDHRQLLAAVASAEHATLCFPRGDLRRHGDRFPSRWLESVGKGAERDEIPSFASGLTRTPFPATAQDHRLASMAIDPAQVLAGDAVLGAGHALAVARLGPAFTRYDGNLAALVHLLPDHTAEGRVSASKLQTYAACPHSYFARYLLNVEPVDDPERKLEMEAVDKGSLVHEILDRFIKEKIAGGEAPPWTTIDRDRVLAIAEEEFAPYEARGATGRAMFWRRDRARLIADLERFIVEDEGVPVATELDFDDVLYPLADGRAVAIRGSIDRVDRAPDGSLVVIDYKTGSTFSYKALHEDDPHQGGKHLQLAMYGVAAADKLGEPRVHAHYWFTSTKGAFERKGYKITDEVRDDVGEAIAAIVDGIRAGVFPNRPSESRPWAFNDCWYCSPDDLGTREARRGWELKRRDLALAGYVRLVEPGVLDDDSD